MISNSLAVNEFPFPLVACSTAAFYQLRRDISSYPARKELRRVSRPVIVFPERRYKIN